MRSNAALEGLATGSSIDQCSHDGLRVEFLVGSVAHRDDEPATDGDVGEPAWCGVAQVESGATSGLDGAGMHPSGGVGAGALRRLFGQHDPQRCRQL